MDFTEAQARTFWNTHASSDPLWAILTDPARHGRRWRLDEFMRHGEREVARVFQALERRAPRRGFVRALDFGSGVGRVSQALGRRCTTVLGVDLSPRMVEIARAINAYPSSVQYVALDLDGVRGLASGTFDLIYSSLVLQHIPPDRSEQYLDELFRLLAPGGVLVFHIPSHRRQPADPIVREMTAAAYRAELRLLDPLPSAVAVGDTGLAHVHVRNASGVAWNQPHVGCLCAGNHWLDSTGRLLVHDDGRAPLPEMFEAGAECMVALPVRAPDRPGDYLLEVDLVHERICWFAERQSAPVRVRVRVAGNAPASAPHSELLTTLDVPAYASESLHPLLTEDSADIATVFPMYGIPKAQVLDLIRRHRGWLLGVDESHFAGPQWVDYRYFVAGS